MFEFLLQEAKLRRWINYQEKKMDYIQVRKLLDKQIVFRTNYTPADIWLESNFKGYFEKCDYDNDAILYSVIACYVPNFLFECPKEKISINMFLFQEGIEIKQNNKIKAFYNNNKRYLHIIYEKYHIFILDIDFVDNARMPMRIGRELFVNSIPKRLRLHAASFVDLKDKAWLIIGNKGSGKTSLLLSAVLNGYSMCSNDRCIIVEREKILVCTVPTSIRISALQRKQVEQMRDNLNMQNIDYKDMGLNKGKFEYSIAEICDYLNTKTSNLKELAGVLVPDFSKKAVKSEKIENSNKKRRCFDMSMLIEDKAFPRYYEDELRQDSYTEIYSKVEELPWYKVSGWLYDFSIDCLKNHSL